MLLLSFFAGELGHGSIKIFCSDNNWGPWPCGIKSQVTGHHFAGTGHGRSSIELQWTVAVASSGSSAHDEVGSSASRNLPSPPFLSMV